MPMGTAPGGMGAPSRGMPGGMGSYGMFTPDPSLPVMYADEASREAIRYHGRRSYPLTPEEHHLGYEGDYRYYDGAPAGEGEAKEPHPLDPNEGLSRIIVRLPHPRFVGAPEFVDGLPKRSTTFAWTELCATREPECAMAPVPQVPEKTWYNTYVYVPEQRSHVERQYLERFVPGPDGEWIDVVKARRLTSFLEEQKRKADMVEEEKRLVESGDVVEMTDFVDAYNGEQLVSCNNRLMTKSEVYERYNIHKSDWGAYVDAVPKFEYDNLRIPWVFGKVDRNKKVSQHVYDWYDRRNPNVVSDRSYKLMELPSYYVDEDLYNKWRATGRNGLMGVADDMATRAKYIDDYPYRM